MSTVISASMVKELRERTGAPMMDCKKALEVASGDIDLAIENMRKSGLARADKKSGRIAAEGLITIQVNTNNTAAAMVETNCETDFVARDSNFVAFANDLAKSALHGSVSERTDLLNALINGEQVELVRAGLVSKLGENIHIRRIQLMEAPDDVVGVYVHGGRIGVMVHLRGGDVTLAKGIAMHIAANKPHVITQTEVSVEFLDKEREIYTAQAMESGKPADIVAKMIEGRMAKVRDEVSLHGQPFVKDPSTTVANILKHAKAEVIAFVRYEVGEGIEKKVDDFVKEVMSQVQGSN